MSNSKNTTKHFSYCNNFPINFQPISKKSIPFFPKTINPNTRPYSNVEPTPFYQLLRPIFLLFTTLSMLRVIPARTANARFHQVRQHGKRISRREPREFREERTREQISRISFEQLRIRSPIFHLFLPFFPSSEFLMQKNIPVNSIFRRKKHSDLHLWTKYSRPVISINLATT